ncbi:MAG: BCD family MFS transporter [Pseudomonadota bacterium]
MRDIGWLGIVRLGLIQTALGAIVVLTTSTLNRIMVVELALPAVLPGALVGFHYAVQMLRPRWGYGSDRGGRHTPWIIGGIATLALGGFLAALATAWMASSLTAGLALAVFAFLLIGIGVGAAGTNLLVLLSKRVPKARLPAAATIVWVMMIVGFIITAGTAGHFLDPYSSERLLAVTGSVSIIAVVLACLAIWRIEGEPQQATEQSAPVNFRKALGEVWSEPDARHFTIFVFVSMLAYSAQDLILEPFAGVGFGMTPGESTKLAGLQHTGVLVGMIAVAVIATRLSGHWLGSLRLWTVIGCVASGGALFTLALGGLFAPHWPLKASVVALGFANGAFAVAAIGSMMALAGRGKARREGTRMGLWGAAQAIAFGSGGFIGALGVDVVRALTGTPILAYVVIFACEGLVFLLAGWLAYRIGQQQAARQELSNAPSLLAIGENLVSSEGKA